MLATPEHTTATRYLSRLTLNLRHRGVQQDLGNSQHLHRRLLEAFGVATRAEAELLYRVEVVRGSSPPAYQTLVQSALPPDWSVLPPGYLQEDDGFGWGDAAGVEVKAIGPLLDRIDVGDRYRFRLRANPTAKTHFREGEVNRFTGQVATRSTPPNGTRVPLLTDRDLEEWMVRQGERHGFRIGEIGWVPDPVSGDRQRGWKRDARPLTHYAVVFEGVLEVTDREAFRDALRHGIGPAKAYGFGLLSLARAVAPA